MPKITITREIEVPDGELCGECQMLDDRSSNYEWCLAFDSEVPWDRAKRKTSKCPQCLEACERAVG